MSGRDGLSPGANPPQLDTGILEQLGEKFPGPISVVNDWHRSGAETYATDFVVGHDKQHLIAKACVKFTPLEAVKEWLERRQVINDAGLTTPKLHIVEGSVVVEEFIPHTLSDAYQNPIAYDSRERLKNGLNDTLQTIYGLGFNALSLHDLRSRGNDVVIIDFGSDLGPQSTPLTNSRPSKVFTHIAQRMLNSG